MAHLFSLLRMTTKEFLKVFPILVVRLLFFESWASLVRIKGRSMASSLAFRGVDKLQA